MTRVYEFQLLQDYKNEGMERATKLLAYQQAVESARSRLIELQTQYEVVFTESVKKGTDATEQLAKLDEDITLQKEVVERKERDARLAQSAMAERSITSVDVVNEYQNVFVPMIRAEYEPNVEAKLKMARDLLLSCIIDDREGEAAYGDLREEIAEISRANRTQGKTKEIFSVDHPTGSAKVLRRQGALDGVREVLNQVALFTEGVNPNDFEYIAEAPKTSKKDGK